MSIIQRRDGYRGVRPTQPYTLIRPGTVEWDYHLNHDEELMRVFRTNNDSMYDTVKALLERDEDPVSPNAFGADSRGDEFNASALEVASEKGYDDIVQLLLEKGANPNINQSGYTPILRAANAHIARMLYGEGADIEACDDDEITALMFAALHGKMDVYNYLISIGADPNRRSYEDMTAAQYITFGEQERARENEELQAQSLIY